MIKIKLYYSIVAILFLFPVSVTKEMTFYLSAKPIYGSYYDKELCQ